MNTTKKILFVLPLLVCMATVTQAQTNHVNSSTTARPFLSISGSDAFCTGSSTYTIIGLLSGSTVLWSVSASNVVMFQPVGDDILLTQIGNGNITLSATVYNPGSSTPSVISKQVSVGTIRAADIIGMQPGTTLTAGQYLTLYVNESAQAYSWYIGGATVIGSTTEPSITVKLDKCYPGQVTYNDFDAGISLQNGCGTGGMYSEHANAVCGGGEEPEFRITVSPNPVSGKELTVVIDNLSKEMKLLNNEAPVSYQLFHFSTKQPVKQWQLKNSSLQRLNISDVKPGEYLMVVTKGKKQQSAKIIIR